MPDGDAGHEGRTRDASHLVQLVHHAGVGDERPAAGQGMGQFGGYQAAQVAGMGTHGVHAVVDHGIVHLVDAAGDGFQQAAPPDDGVEGKGNALVLQLGEHQVLAELKLVDDTRKVHQLVDGVAQRLDKYRLFVLENGHLGRGGAGVDD